MVDPARIAAFMVVTAMASITPGPQMIFVLGQTAWRGARGGIAALLGLQIGNAGWFVLAGLGLGTVAKGMPMAFTALTLAGAAYLAWLGMTAWRHASVDGAELPDGPPRRVSDHAFRDSLLVAASNPKSLVYVLALLPPFIDLQQPVAPQMLALAAVAILIDFAIGGIYIAAGNGLARAIDKPSVRQWLDRAVGTIFLLLAIAVLYRTFGTGVFAVPAS